MNGYKQRYQRNTTGYRRRTQKKRRYRNSQRYGRTYKKGAVNPYRTPITTQVGLPSKIYLKLRYGDDQWTMSTAAALFYTENVFRGNSLYDPDFTGVGVQPYEYDPLTSIYIRSRVLASKIKCYFYTTTALATVPNIKVYCYPSQNSAPYTYVESSDYANIKNCQMIQFNIDSLSQRKAKIKNFCKTSFFYPKQTNDIDVSHTYATNPASGWFWHVITDTSHLATAATIYMDVQIVYYTEFYQLRDLDQS